MLVEEAPSGAARDKIGGAARGGDDGEIERDVWKRKAAAKGGKEILAR